MVNEMKHTYPAFLAASVVICTAIAQYLIYFYAPVEQTLGYAQKYFIIIACRVVGFRQLFLRRPFRRPLSSEKRREFQHIKPRQCRSRLFAGDSHAYHRQPLGKTFLGSLVDMGSETHHSPYLMVHFRGVFGDTHHAHAP